MNDFDTILAAMLEGEAKPEDIAALVDAARTDDALRSKLAGITTIHGMLGVVLESEFTRERNRMKILEAVRNSDREAFVGAVRRKVHRPRRFAIYGLSAAAAAVACFVGWNLFNPGRNDVAGRIVATLSRAETVTWSDAGGAPQNGTILAGQHLRLDAGLVELQVAERGRMIVEGPADLEFTAADRAVLHRGRVVMRVTPQGHGYRMETPEGTIVDLGTEFAVSVNASGNTETHVLDGEVEAFPNGGGKVLLKRDDALRFAHGGERIAADGGDFYTALPPARGSHTNHIHWPLDTITDNTTPAFSTGMPPGPKDFRLLSFRNAGDRPTGAEGVFGQALHFSSRNAYAESDFRGIGGAQPRTVALWVKVPVDFQTKEGFSLVSWGRFADDHPGEVWQVAVNPIRDDGPIGRLRLGTHRGRIIGTTDLRDGKWHHVAVVLYGGSRPNIGTHVLLYLDGKLESISRRTLTEVSTEIEKATHGMWLGRDITDDNLTKGAAAGRYFRGDMDEIHLFDAALSQEDIRRLMDRNDPPP